MDWKDVLGFSVIAALITAVLNLGSTWLMAWRQQKKSADFDAMRLAVVLERFSYECASRIADEQTWRDSHGNAGREFFDLPSLTLPEDVAWRCLSIDLVDRLFTLDNDLFRSASIIIGEREYIFEPDGRANEPAEQAGLIGYRAHVLAQAWRAHYQPNRMAPGPQGWDHVAILRPKHDAKIEEYRRNDEICNAPE